MPASAELKSKRFNPPSIIRFSKFVLNYWRLTDEWRSGGHDGTRVALSYPSFYATSHSYFYAMIYGPFWAILYYALYLLPLQLCHPIHTLQRKWLDFGLFANHTLKLLVISLVSLSNLHSRRSKTDRFGLGRLLGISLKFLSIFFIFQNPDST